MILQFWRITKIFVNALNSKNGRKRRMVRTRPNYREGRTRRHFWRKWTKRKKGWWRGSRRPRRSWQKNWRGFKILRRKTTRQSQTSHSRNIGRCEMGCYLVMEIYMEKKIHVMLTDEENLFCSFLIVIQIDAREIHRNTSSGDKYHGYAIGNLWWVNINH